MVQHMVLERHDYYEIRPINPVYYRKLTPKDGIFVVVDIAAVRTPERVSVCRELFIPVLTAYVCFILPAFLIMIYAIILNAK